MKVNLLVSLLSTTMLLACCQTYIPEDEFSISQGDSYSTKEKYSEFLMTGQARTDSLSVARILFASDGTSGYEVLFHGGPMDGSCKTGSLSAIRNLYRSLPADNEWFDFEIAVRKKNISVALNGTDVVCYTEPTNPYRTPEYASRLLGDGRIFLEGVSGNVDFRDIRIEALEPGTWNPADSLPAIDEQSDQVIRFQQAGFPVIDYHVHLKGGLTKEQASAMSMNYGINYGVAPNAGEGGVGRMLADDMEVYDYFNEVKDMPFIRGVQGEGRRWPVQFSQEALGVFDYMFTDAMTIVDPAGRIARIYHPEEVFKYGMTDDEWMDMLVDQIVLILTNEPVDIYANATYIPDDMMPDYDRLWTPERVDRVLDVLQKNSIALEISARYKIPNERIIKAAKARGIMFTFGTNNVDADFGRLEYSLQMAEKCGLEPSDIWFPTMSIRNTRKVVNYNNF